MIEMYLKKILLGILFFTTLFSVNVHSQGKVGEIELDHVLSIKSPSGDEVFGDIMQVLADDRGRIYVSDFIMKKILVFDGEGVLIKELGRKGRGPGEFQLVVPNGMAYDNNSELAVIDPKQLLINFFDTESLQFIASKKLNVLGEDYRPREVYYSNGSNGLLVGYHKSYSYTQREMSRNEKIFLLDNNQLSSNPLIEVKGDQKLIDRSEGYISVGYMPFGERSFVKVGNDHFYSSWSGDGVVKVYDSNGNEINSFSIPYKPVELKKEDFLNLEFPKISGKKYRMFKNKYPKEYPVFDGFVVDDKERVWVTANIEDRDKYKVMVLSNKGELLGEGYVGKDFKLMDVRDGYMYGISHLYAKDQSVEKYKINLSY
ncbi:MAG: 6-bladed beta-propeller [Bacteroidota bacterium]